MGPDLTENFSLDTILDEFINVTIIIYNIIITLIIRTEISIKLTP